jgi:hypothetical protein
MSNSMSRIKKTDEKTPWARKALERDLSIKRQVRNTFLIYCEGANTEPKYFEAFPVNTETIVLAIGLGMSRSALVKEIIHRVLKEGYLKGQPHYDDDRQIWCVFDRDDRSLPGEDEDFDEAVRLATEHGLRVAYSNDSFELWFCLHDHYIDSQLHRKQFYKRLSKRLGISYETDGKGEDFAKSLYALFLPSQAKAIRHAERLHKSYEAEPRPSRHNPCTTVYQLVTALNKCLKQ